MNVTEVISVESVFCKSCMSHMSRCEEPDDWKCMCGVFGEGFMYTCSTRFLITETEPHIPDNIPETMARLNVTMEQVRTMVSTVVRTLSALTKEIETITALMPNESDTDSDESTTECTNHAWMPTSITDTIDEPSENVLSCTRCGAGVEAIHGVKLKLWTNSTEYYWAYSMVHLEYVWYTGHEGECYENEYGKSMEDCWYEYLPDSFTITSTERADLPSLPAGAVIEENDGMWECTAPIVAWRAIAVPGFFASTGV